MHAGCARKSCRLAASRVASSTRCWGSNVIDRQLLDHLQNRGVRFCLIGASALASHGWARYTADVDLLTMDDAVLSPRFWSGFGEPEIRRGDQDDPLAGLVRFAGEFAHDVIVGRGRAMSF